MPSTFSAFDFSNSKSEEEDPHTEPRAGAANVTLAFIGCPSSHTEISLDFEASPKDSGNSEPGDDAPSKSPERGRKPSADREQITPAESPASRLAKIKRNRELEQKLNKKQPVRRDASKAGEPSRKYRDVYRTKYSALERGETQSKNGHEDRVSPMLFGNSSKVSEKSPRKTASLHKQTPADPCGTAQRKRSRERSGEVKALTRLRTCLKGLKAKPKAEDLMETQTDDVRTDGNLRQSAQSTKQMRLPRAQGDMEMPPKGKEGSFSKAGRHGGPNYCSRSDTREPDQFHHHHRSRSRGYPTIDRMFADVMKTLIIQSGPESSPGITSIYDVGDDKEHFSYGSSCTLRVDRESGRATDSGSEELTMVTTTCGDKPSGGDFARESLLRAAVEPAATKGPPPADGEKARGFENKNCSHYVEDGFEDEALEGFEPEAMSDTPEDMYDAFDQVVDRMDEEETEIGDRKNGAKATVPPFQVNEIDSYGDKWKLCTDQTRTVAGIRFDDMADKFIALNKNNSLKERGLSNEKSNSEKSLENFTSITPDESSSVQNISPGLSRDSIGAGGGGGGGCCQRTGGVAAEILITLTPPSPKHSSSTESLSPSLSDAPAVGEDDDFLAAPTVSAPLRARMPSGGELAVKGPSPGSSVGSDQELADICNASASRSFGFDGRPKAGQGRRSVIKWYFEKTRDAIRSIRSRSTSPMNVFAKINRMCGRGKEELQLIKSWSFSEVVSLMDKTGLYRPTGGCTELRNTRGFYQNEKGGAVEEDAEGASGAQVPSPSRPGDAHSPVFCLNPYGGNDLTDQSPPGESVYAPGSSRNYASCSSSHRPQPVHGKASDSGVAYFHSWKGRACIAEKSAGNLDGRKRKSAFCKYEQIGFGAGICSTLAQVSEETEPASRPLEDDDGDDGATVAEETSSELELRSACTQASQSCSRVRCRKSDAEDDEMKPAESAPAKSQSLVQASGAGPKESCAGDVMALLAREVTIKRYPSFTDLTDIDDESKATKNRAAEEAQRERSEGDSVQGMQTGNTSSRLEDTAKANSDQTAVSDNLQSDQTPAVAEIGVEKLTPPNSPNVGVLTGARVQTIVSLLESCTVLRTERGGQSLCLAAVGATESLSRFLKKSDAAGCLAPDESNKTHLELKLPSPPLASPGDSSCDTLGSVPSPPETFQHCEPSTSRFAIASQERVLRRHKERSLTHETKEEGEEDTIDISPVSKLLASLQSDEPADLPGAYLPTPQPTERLDPRKQKCNKGSKNAPVLLFDAETTERPISPAHLGGIHKKATASVMPFKGADIIQPLKFKSDTFSKVDPEVISPPASCYVIDKPFIGVKLRGAKEHESEQIPHGGSEGSHHLPQRADHDQQQTSHRARSSRKIKWVTDSSSGDDDVSANSSASSSFSDRSDRFHAVIDFKDTVLENFPIRPANEIQGHEVDSARSSQSGMDADRSEDGVRSDSNNNISVASENCWIRLHKGLPCKDYRARLRTADVCWKRFCAVGKGRRRGDTEVSGGYRGRLLPTKHPLLVDPALVIDVSEEKKKNLYSLLRASQISGVSDPEDYSESFKKGFAPDSRDVKSVESTASSVVDPELPVEDAIEPRSVSECSNARPYRFIRKEETFTTDPRRTGTRSRDAKTSQSYQRHAYSTAPQPRPSRNLVRLPKHPKRNDVSAAAAELNLFDRTSPDASKSGGGGGAARGQARAETCFVPKFPKNFWEGTSTLHGQEVPTEPALRKTPTPSPPAPPPPPPAVAVAHPAAKQSRLRARLQRSEASAPRASDFVKRSSFQIERCDRLIRKSVDVIRVSQITVEQSKRRLEATAEQMKRLTDT